MCPDRFIPGRADTLILEDAVQLLETYRVEDLARWWELGAVSLRRQQLIGIAKSTASSAPRHARGHCLKLSKQLTRLEGTIVPI